MTDGVTLIISHFSSRETCGRTKQVIFSVPARSQLLPLTCLAGAGYSDSLGTLGKEENCIMALLVLSVVIPSFPLLKFGHLQHRLF